MYNYLPGEVEHTLIVDKGNVEAYVGQVGTKWSYETYPDDYPPDFPDDMDNYFRRNKEGCPYQGFMKYIVAKDHPEKEPYIEMRQLFVRTLDRRKGVANKLFDELPGICKEEGIKRVVVAAYFEEGQDNDFAKFLRARKYKQLPHTPNEFDWEKYV